MAFKGGKSGARTCVGLLNTLRYKADSERLITVRISGSEGR